MACWVLRVSTSGYYEWRGRAPSPRAVADEMLRAQIVEIHATSRGTYGAPRVHAELRLGRGVRCGRKRVARRAMALVGLWQDVPDEEIDALLADLRAARDRDTGRRVDLGA